MRKALFLLVIIVGIIFAHQVKANHAYLINQQYFEDTSNSLTLDQIKNHKFDHFDGWLAEGYRPSTFWIKLTIAPSDKDLVLRIRPNFAEHIQLYDSFDQSKVRTTGAVTPWINSDIQAYSHNFILAPHSDARSIFLSIKSNRTYLLSFDVMTMSEYLVDDHRNGLLYAGYTVFCFAIAFVLLGSWLVNREYVLGIFTIRQWIAFLHTFFVVGYGRIFLDQYIDIDVVNYLTYLIVVCYPLIGIYANKLLFQEYGLKRSYRYFFNGLLVGSFLVVLLVLSGNINDALKLNAQLVLVLMFALMFAAWFGTSNTGSPNSINLPIGFLRAIYTFNFLIWSLSVLPMIGLLGGKEIALHSYLLYNMVSGLIFFWLLQFRARSILKKEYIKSNTLKNEADYERSRREEQGKLMAMLTHEIRTPLSILKLVIDRKVAGSDLQDYANRAVGNIDAIIDKCIQLDQLDLDSLKLHKTKFDLMKLVNSIIIDSESSQRFLIRTTGNIELYADENIFRTIFSNLIINALKYSNPNTPILIDSRIISSNHSKNLQFMIQNHSDVLENLALEQIFDKYYRGPAANRVSGSGLGLFLVKGLVHALNGEVRCTAKDNLITFDVWVPI